MGTSKNSCHFDFTDQNGGSKPPPYEHDPIFAYGRLYVFAVRKTRRNFVKYGGNCSVEISLDKFIEGTSKNFRTYCVGTSPILPTEPQINRDTADL